MAYSLKEIDREPKTDEVAVPAKKRVPKFVFKVQRRIRHWKEGLAEDWQAVRKEDVKEYRHMARRLFRRALKAVLIQWDDLRLAAREIKARVEAELQPVEPASEKASPIGKTLLPREARNTAALASRPSALREQGVKMERVLVVGGMEFFGAAIVRHLNRHGVRNIVIADSLDTACWKQLPALQFEEFLSLSELAQGLSGRGRTHGVFSHVFYCGDWEEGESPLALPKMLLTATFGGGGRFVAISSAASLGPEPNRKDILKGAAEKFRPQTKAGVMACLFDRYAMGKLPPRSYLSLKHFRLFGPGERKDGMLYGITSEIHDQIVRGEEIRLPACLHADASEGCREHDFLHVASAAAMAVWLAETETTSGIYELGSGRSAKAIDLINAVAAAHGVKPQVAWQKESHLPSSAEPERADLSRQRENGWTTVEPPLEVMVKRYVDFLKTGEEPPEILSVVEEAPPVPESAPLIAPRVIPSRKKPFQPRAAA